MEDTFNGYAPSCSGDNLCWFCHLRQISTGPVNCRSLGRKNRVGNGDSIYYRANVVHPNDVSTIQNTRHDCPQGAEQALSSRLICGLSG